MRSSSAAVANRLPRVVTWAATLWLRPAIARPSCSTASRARRARVATMRSSTSSRLRRTCSCSTFSVRSRDVIPLWMCSWPARAQNSSIRAFTSWRVTRSRSRMDSRSTWSSTARWSSITPSGMSTPSSRWASMTAIQSSRSITTLASGDQSSAMGLLAYREARTFSMCIGSKRLPVPLLSAAPFRPCAPPGPRPVPDHRPPTSGRPGVRRSSHRRRPRWPPGCPSASGRWRAANPSH